MAISNIEEAVQSALTGNATLAGLVSTRIYPLFVPQEQSLPAVSFFRVDTVRNHGMGGDISLMESRIQVSIFADYLNETRTIGDAVRGVLSRWKGTYGSVVIQDSLLDGESDEFDSETETHQCMQDYIIFHT